MLQRRGKGDAKAGERRALSPGGQASAGYDADDDKMSKPKRRLMTLIAIGGVFVVMLYVLVIATPSPHEQFQQRQDLQQSNHAPETPPIQKTTTTKARLGGADEEKQPTTRGGDAPIQPKTTKVWKKWDPAPRDANGVHYHIVFSTGCSIYQDWQSFVFFYHAMAVDQPGTVTRIVSGCTDEEETTLQTMFDEQIRPMNPDRFRIHFTPDYSTVKGDGSKFVYFNKPFGMRHWLQNALGYPDNPIDEDSIVVLMDPDQLILRPFRDNDFSNAQWKFLPKGQEPRTKIEHGYPMGQLYGFALQWKQKINMTKVLPNEVSPVTTMSNQEARAGYIVGPPYVATTRDFYQIASKWSEIAPAVHDQYPYLLAEMFAYCLAAAHLKLAHQTAISFMISDVGVGAGGEGWGYIDRIPDDQICSDHIPEKDLPNVIHFCQRYGINNYFFGKRRLPKDFLTCEAPLLREPTLDDLHGNHVAWPTGNDKDWSDEHAKRNRFVLCHLIPALNAAAEYYKKHNCPKEPEPNLLRIFMFSEERKKGKH